MDTPTLLRVALSARRQTAGEFAASLTPPVSESMLYAVARGDKTSERVKAAIEDLIGSEIGRLRLISVPARKAA